MAALEGEVGELIDLGDLDVRGRAPGASCRRRAQPCAAARARDAARRSNALKCRAAPRAPAAAGGDPDDDGDIYAGLCGDGEIDRRLQQDRIGEVGRGASRRASASARARARFRSEPPLCSQPAC
jgi:hypothetical protein